jgi:hypothetical protein
MVVGTAGKVAAAAAAAAAADDDDAEAETAAASGDGFSGEQDDPDSRRAPSARPICRSSIAVASSPLTGDPVAANRLAMIPNPSPSPPCGPSAPGGHDVARLSACEATGCRITTSDDDDPATDDAADAAAPAAAVVAVAFAAAAAAAEDAAAAARDAAVPPRGTGRNGLLRRCECCWP